MDLRQIIDQTVDIAVSIEDRNLGGQLNKLARELHVLWFDPSVAVPILEELAEHGHLVTMTRSEALARFNHESRSITKVLMELEDLLRTHGRSIFTPSQYAQLSEYGKTKRSLRSDIGRAFDNDIRSTIDELIKSPARFPNGLEPYEQIKATAREILTRIGSANMQLDRAHELVAKAIVPSALNRRRWPRVGWVSMVVLCVGVALGLAWILAGDSIATKFDEIRAGLIDLFRR